MHNYIKCQLFSTSLEYKTSTQKIYKKNRCIKLREKLQIFRHAWPYCDAKICSLLAYTVPSTSLAKIKFSEMCVILFCLAHVPGCQNRLYQIHYENFVRVILIRKILCPVTALCLLYIKRSLSTGHGQLSMSMRSPAEPRC